MQIGEFILKDNVAEWNIDEYLSVLEILNREEYPELKDKDGKLYTSATALDKQDRTEEFMLSLWQEVIKLLSDIPVSFLSNELLLNYCKDVIEVSFQSVDSLLEDDTEFILNDKVLDKPDYFKWTFERWVDLENKTQKGMQYYDKDTDELVTDVNGNRLILALTYGDMCKDIDGLVEKMNYFNTLPITKTLKPYAEQMETLKNIKEHHNMLYASGGGGSSGVNIKKHNKIFGWVDVIRGLSAEGVFGTYIEVKNSPLMEVLEYLNCNTSYNKAEYLDMKAQQ